MCWWDVSTRTHTYKAPKARRPIPTHITSKMAAQCSLNPSFVSSNAYYGYVPVAQSTKLEAPACNRPAADTHDMDVDAESIDTQQTGRVACARKRGLGHEELVAYMPRLKRLREGDYIWPEDCGLAQMYHESTVLRLSPAADFDMACAPLMANTGNLKFQSPAQLRSKTSPIRSQELEDMLMLTHGCTSYHHYRQSQPYLMNDSVETEF